MEGSGTGQSDDGRRAVRMLRRVALCVDAAGMVAVLMGRQDAATCAGILAVVLRCVAECREGAARR
ncbi:hypothetical protein GA0074692_5073 [Micromonospora pallida]|uniref:Uncharacterized protein n=1 Tax=Micromonospora pallida TaxID=145854 RepID=A0A1C6TAX1_9ACTN|nr:hypothetical protein [Micromonospora pallida]SCL38615.1 hypothetical protein GA0074692_5073 [Micromonospora pallida]